MVLPQSMRIKGHKCFDHIHRNGKRFNGSLMTLKLANSKPSLLSKNNFKTDIKVFKCAITISNKVSKRAVKRNRLRRIFHDHLKIRLNSSRRNDGYWALISLKPHSCNEEISPLLIECDQLLKKAGLIL